MTAGDKASAVLIAALSGRALAACACRGGYRPLVADLFGDLDTRALAEASERVPGNLRRGFKQGALLGALDRLSAGRRVIGVVVGSGFEDRPRLLQALAGRHVLLGNAAETVLAIKDPFHFAETCALASVPHPEIRRERPAEGAWLRKRVGGSGGVHVSASTRRTGVRHGWYYQRRVAGDSISAAFLASKGRCVMLGLSRQWTDPSAYQPFRYGGASRPACVSLVQATEIGDAVARLVSHTGLCGLNSADFLVRRDGLDLLEVNPRPTATLDIFPDPSGVLFRFHIDACAGVLPVTTPAWPGAAAAATVYSDGDICLPANFAWPDWAADRQPSGEPVPGGAPLCTVLGEAPDATAAEGLVRDRATEILARARGDL